MALPAGISPATWRFEAARSDSLSYGSMSWGRRGDSHSRGADLPGSLRNCRRVQTPVAAEPRRHEMACQAEATQGEKPAYALACFGAAAFATRCADGEGWWVAMVLPRALRFKRPLHRCNAC